MAMMQKSIASDEAEMRYALQTILSIYSKYILYSLTYGLFLARYYVILRIHTGTVYIAPFSRYTICAHTGVM